MQFTIRDAMPEDSDKLIELTALAAMKGTIGLRVERQAMNYLQLYRLNKLINLFQLESHPDHHIQPSRPFDKLSIYDESPEHPAGNSFMVLLSLVPPLWFKIMNKRILN